MASKGTIPWNAGKTKLTDERIRKQAMSLAKTLTGRPLPVTAESYKKGLATRRARGTVVAGYIPGSGRGKSGWYDGFWCDSTWELAYYIWCKSNGKNIVRNTQRFPYVFEGKSHYYLPDFIVDGQLVEIKGRRKTDPLIEAKRNATGNAVMILFELEMKPILKSVEHLQPLKNLYGSVGERFNPAVSKTASPLLDT